MPSNRQEIDGVKADVHQTKQEVTLAQQAGDLAQVDFHRRRLLQLESQLSSLREQQTILLQSSQQCLSSPLMTSTEAQTDMQVDPQPVLDATEKAADRVVEPLQSHGFAWLKVSKSDTRSFRRLQQYTNEPDSCFEQAGKLLRDKRLVQYNTEKPSSRLAPAVCTAADRVCKLMDCHARHILEAISRSHYLGLTSSSLDCILDNGDPALGQAAASSLDVAQYMGPSQSDQLEESEGHIDRGILTLIWSNSRSGLWVASPRGGQLAPVELPEGYMLVLSGYTLEHVTCGMFKAAPHDVVLSDQTTKRLAFAYKLRSPSDAVLSQYHNLSASSKDHKYMRGVTASELMRRFDQDHASINQVTDLVQFGLSPEWQHSVNEWRMTKYLVDDDWIWHRLISTMGWQRPDRTIHFRTTARQTFSLRAHFTWNTAGLGSLLEVVHGMGPLGSLRMIFGGRQLAYGVILSEIKVQDGDTIHVVNRMKGD